MQKLNFIRKTIFLALSVFPVLLPVNAEALFDDAKSEEAQFAPGEIIVKFKPETAAKVHETLSAVNLTADPQAVPVPSIKDLSSRFSAHSIEPVFKSRHQKAKQAGKAVSPSASSQIENVYLLKLGSDANLDEAIEAFKKDPSVEYAEKNLITKVQMIPNDPYYSSSSSWGQPYGDLWGLKPDKIDAEHAWDLAQGEGIVVAVIDTGVDYNHPDLGQNVWINPGEDLNQNGAVDTTDFNGIDDDQNGYVDDIRGWDFVTYDGTPEDNDPMDGHGHGTHVAGTIAAVGNNSLGVIGVAPQAKIMAVKGLTDQGYGTDADLAQAVIYAAENGARITNNSWGGSGSSQLLTDAFHYADSLGVLNIAAAGNSSADVSGFTPANIDVVMAVAATAEYDEKTSFSNYGEKIDVSAPGGSRDGTPNILSSMSDTSVLAGNNPSLRVANGYYRLQGTSMACPHVAGAAALLSAYFPGISNNDLRRRIKGSVDPFPVITVDPIGTGRLDVYRAFSGEQPNLVISNIELNDENGDGLLSSQERVELVITIKNVWLSAASVSAAIASSDSSFISLLTSTTDYGAVAESEVKSNSAAPFVFQIGSIPQQESIAHFTLTLTADGHEQAFNFSVTLGIKKLNLIGPNLDVIRPRIELLPSDGNKMVYDYDDFKAISYDKGIYVYDVITGDKRQISWSPSDAWLSLEYPPMISGDKIVWEDQRHGYSNKDIYLYDLSTNQERQITTDTFSQRRPTISGNKIVWQDNRNGNEEIYFYDLSAGIETRITNNPAADRVPFISGNRIVWLREVGPSGYDYIYDVMVYDLATGQEQRITTQTFNSPSIQIAGDKLVWSDLRNGNADVFLYDLSTSQERQITTNAAYQFHPCLSGNTIVWYDTRHIRSSTSSNDTEIYAYDLNTDQEFRVTTDTEADDSYPIIAGGKIVWFRKVRGTSLHDFFMADIPVANRAPVFAPLPPQTVNAGQTLTFAVQASDPDGDTLTYSASGLPKGASFNSTTHTFTWRPSTSTSGSFVINFQVSDGQLSASMSVTITVINDPIRILSLSDSPDPFSPNGDGVNDTTTISAAFNRAAGWALRIKNSSNLQVFFAKGNGASMTKSWNGRDSAGLALPAGVYSYTLTATDSGGSTVSQSGTVTLSL